VIDQTRMANQPLLELLLDELAERLAPRLANVVASNASSNTTPWLTTVEAIEYTRLPPGTFRKLSACGKIPAHGGRSKLFYRPELDQALLGFDGLVDGHRPVNRAR
jgi:hypothetical protein